MFSYCCASGLVFSSIGVYQYMLFGISHRLIATMMFASTTLLFHSVFQLLPPNHLTTRLTYWIDQIVLWPCGAVILCDDMSWLVLVLVLFAVCAHFTFRPLQDCHHCCFVHLPVMAAMILQRPQSALG